MSRYRVTAPLVLAQDHDKRVHHRYEGQLIPWLPDEQRDHLLAEGMIELVDEPVPPGVVSPADAQAEEAPEADSAEKPDRPNQVSTKEVWVDYAVRALGIDQAEAEAMTKADLIALPAQ